MKLASLIAAVPIGLYCFGAFVSLQPNMLMWSEEGRFLYATGSFFAGAFLVVIYGESEK